MRVGAGRVDLSSWTGESHDQLSGQVPGASWTKHPQEGNPAGPDSEAEEMDEPQCPCAPLTRVPSV